MMTLPRTVESLLIRGISLQNHSKYRWKGDGRRLAMNHALEEKVHESTAAIAVAPTEGSPPQSKLLRPPPKFEPTPYQYLEELTVRIENLTNLGEGVARHGDSGWVVMVPHVIPGELVKCKVFRNHGSYSEATLTEVLEPSPHRVDPECPLFGLCGGCQYQHMSVKTQREWKRQQVVDVLMRIAGISGPEVEVQPTLGTEHTYGYRSKLTPHYDTPVKGEVRAIGFQRVKFPTVFHGMDPGEVAMHKVVDVPRCLIATPGINEALPGARAEALERVREAFSSGGGKRAGRRGSTLLFRETEEGTGTDPNAEVSARVNGLLFKFKAGEFFQNNPFVLPLMVDYVVSQARKGGTRYLIDAYCGGGLFCLSASPSFEKCAGIEISTNAVEGATRNAALNGIGNCLFLAGTASNIFANVSFNPRETVIIIDPPSRKGCDNMFLEQLFKFRPTRLVYVSCDPATQARDTKEIVSNGYRPVDIQPFDLFPQTRHIENVITFEDAQEHL
ncbi:unnamed protein product [Discosporangium mesarthrocarpum]